MMTRVVTGTILLAGITAGCQVFGPRGEGPVTSETRQLTGFTRVDAGNGIGVTVRIGPSQPVEVRAQANILPVIRTTVDGQTLQIDSSQGFSTSEVVEVVIVTPTIEQIALSGGSQGQIEGVDVERLEVELSGGAGLTATGKAGEVALEMSGGSRAAFDELSATTVRIDLSGGASTTVQASGEVTGSASGGSRITVLGDARLEVETTGGSEAVHG